MFRHLCVYHPILVSGPQRSGTRIAARIISADTGHRFMAEEEFGVHSRRRFRAEIANCRDVVVQCPTMCRYLHEIADDSTLVVMMMRDLDDIAASEKRIGWTGGAYIELEKYGYNRQAAKTYRKVGGQIAAIKYLYWEKSQREQIQHWLELEYELLAGHPLWVPKELRADFAADQTEAR